MAPSVQRRKVWLTPTTRVPWSNAAKTRNPFKLPGVPQTITKRSQPLVGRSSPYCEDIWRKYCCLTFFPIVDTCLPIVTDRVAWSVGLSICQSTEPCKRAQTIEIPFGLWTRVDKKKHVLDGLHTCATWRIQLHLHMRRQCCIFVKKITLC